ncbi:MAG: pyridoxal-5'-phosphate-dependent protein, partial [Alphaproteobacteria bacterium]|nr:pyridoxal-5'-phosphate-dependent protein [Alphaproteobacteria bacterium]
METENFDRLFTEILQARTRVYHAGDPTPLEKISVPCVEAETGAEIYVKREDLSPINAYKWRG